MTVSSLVFERRLNIIVVALTILPLAALAAYIARYRVDVFYWDQWEMVPVVEKLMRGTLSFADLWHQHNEHRPVFPRLILACLAKTTGWSTLAELSFNYVLCLTLLPILMWAMKQWHAGRDAVPVWTWPAVALVVFSPTQWENWLWGWQLLALLQMVALVAGLAVLCRRNLGWPSLAGTIALGIVGTFSLSPGLLYWPIGLAVLIAKPSPARGRHVACWMLFAAAVIGAYFAGFARNPHTPSPLLNFVSWLEFYHYLGYVAAFLGAPLAPSHVRAAQLAGLAGVAFYAVFTIKALLRRWAGCEDALAISLGASAILAGMLVGLGRAPYGSVHALTSHYVSSSLWLWVSVLLFLAAFATEETALSVTRTRRTFSASVAAAIGLCVIVLGWPTAIREGRMWHARLSPPREVLTTSDNNLPPLKALYPVPEVVIERRQVLVEFHLWAFRDGDPALIPASTPIGQ